MADDAFDELSDPLGFTPEPEGEDEAAAIPQPHLPPFRIPSGKYQGLILPRMIPIKPSMLAQVEAIREQIIADPEFQRHASSISQTYAELRREAEEKAAELREIKTRLAAVQLLMCDQYEAEATSTIKHHNGDIVRIQSEPHLIVTDKEQFRQSCLAAGLEALMVLPWGTANKLMKDRACEALEPFPGADLYMRPKVFFTNGMKNFAKVKK
jgi:hypothetical protein